MIRQRYLDVNDLLLYSIKILKPISHGCVAQKSYVYSEWNNPADVQERPGYVLGLSGMLST